MIRDALALLGANICFAAAGLGVLSLLTRRALAGWSLALAYMAGVATVGVLTPLLLIAGLSIGVFETLILCAGLALPAVLLRGRLAERGSNSFQPMGRRSAPARLAAGVVGGFLMLLAVDLWFQPLWAYDGWAMWTAKARALVLLDGLSTDYFARAASTPEHPLLLSALEAIDFRFMGFDTRILHLQFWLLLVGFVGSLVALLQDRVRAVVLWPSLLALILAPALAYQTATAYADVPLGIFVALAGICAWRWLVAAEGGALALLALFSAAACATKFEGAIYVGALMLTVIVLASLASRRQAALAGAVAMVSLVGIVPWRLWMWHHGIAQYHSVGGSLDARLLLSRADRLPIALTRFVRELLDPTSWLLLVPLALAAAVLAGIHATWRRGAGLFLGTGTVVLLALSGVYWLTPLPFRFQLDTSAPRVIIGLALLCGAFLPVLLTEALGGREALEIGDQR